MCNKRQCPYVYIAYIMKTQKLVTTRPCLTESCKDCS